MKELARLLDQYERVCDKTYDTSGVKKCVFCGENPVSKNREHILPRWLIEYTGHPKRSMNLPVYDEQKRSFHLKHIPFDQFVFPACERCNSGFSDLEASVRQALFDLLDRRTVNLQSAETLLDWFDKIRVGLWLAAQIWDKAPIGIQPKFHIGTRIARHDRLLYISTCKQSKKGLRFTGINDPIFKCLPSYVSLRICSMAFVSASHIGICAGALGLPKVKVDRLLDDEYGMVNIIMPKPGKRSNWPAAPARFGILAQACYGDALQEVEVDKNVRDRMIDDCRSKPHLFTDGHLTWLDSTTTLLTLHEYETSEDLSEAELQLLGKLRKHVVRAIPNHVQKSHRIWKKILTRMLILYPIG
jgi:hypothetical protein